jgi:hypothetical protein
MTRVYGMPGGSRTTRKGFLRVWRKKERHILEQREGTPRVMA